MTRQQRRRAEREIQKYIERDGDRCSICRAAFKHNDRSYGGIDAKGAAVVVSDCCKSHLVCLLAEGIYTKHGYDFFDRGSGPQRPQRQLSSEEIGETLGVLQWLIGEADQMADTVKKRAGYADSQPVSINFCSHPWKEDDRLWFLERPRRAHRVREPFAGEIQIGEVPAGRVHILIVRQIEPGQRVRQSFFLNQKLMPVPDDEAIAHCLFEVACGRVGTEWSDLQNAVERYESMQMQ